MKKCQYIDNKLLDTTTLYGLSCILRYLYSNKSNLLNIGFAYPTSTVSPFHFLISSLNISEEDAVLRQLGNRFQI